PGCIRCRERERKESGKCAEIGAPSLLLRKPGERVLPTVTRDILRFGPFAVHRRRGQLIGENGPIAVRPKSFALLCHFIEQAGRLLAKDELARAVWKDAAVT